MTMDDDFDGTVLNETYRRARKPHKCGLCGEEILVGESHFCQSVAEDGTVWTFRAHRECDEKFRSEPGLWYYGYDTYVNDEDEPFQRPRGGVDAQAA